MATNRRTGGGRNSEVNFRGEKRSNQTKRTSREVSLWEQYLWAILLIGAVLVLQTALIGVLLYEHRRRAAEVESLKRMAELAYLCRQTTAGELLASIAHELNQPLGAILSNTETVELMLESQARNLEEIKTILADIKRADQRATDVIERLRRLLTKTQAETQGIDLNETVREVVRILAAQAAAHNVTLKTVLIPHPLKVKGDRVQLGAGHSQPGCECHRCACYGGYGQSPDQSSYRSRRRAHGGALGFG